MRRLLLLFVVFGVFVLAVDGWKWYRQLAFDATVRENLDRQDQESMRAP